MENRKPVVLQAHLDMVPQKNNDTVHDFTKILSSLILMANGLKRAAPRWVQITALVWRLRWRFWLTKTWFTARWRLSTMTEEAGMDGAFGLQSNWLQADILINTDSEEEGEIYMGCAGASTSPPTCIWIS